MDKADFSGPFAFPFALPEGGAELSTEVDVIDRGRIPSLTRDVGVLAVAPVIPMKLIAPVGEIIAIGCLTLRSSVHGIARRFLKGKDPSGTSQPFPGADARATEGQGADRPILKEL
jgi:hypothetical protein